MTARGPVARSAQGSERGDNVVVLSAARQRRNSTNDRVLRALFEQHAPRMSGNVRHILATTSDPGCQLKRLVQMQTAAAIQMRGFIPLIFGEQALPPDVSLRWRRWHQHFEEDWAGVVEACMDAGYLDRADALMTTRLIMSVTIGAVQHRSESAEDLDAQEIADSVCLLLGIASLT